VEQYAVDYDNRQRCVDNSASVSQTATHYLLRFSENLKWLLRTAHPWCRGPSLPEHERVYSARRTEHPRLWNQ
jgi:hypothetical protein